ncbi:MAG: 2-amino-4-hydroxy-6-hydroxymethyldihydropteridine diphosphokinase [Planctomycetes bacterium]|nr:2-amino-4-hydroxy-6-hydroxymethyldihydropteridine diphosphokinase [Planctomycetota bacterium]MBU1518654.1 2-amino-4-hydroxy-6-hydroxymethyldihydropteridine diphosphokinase [Planctomycetota bacterium]MBU2458126.1 2-amino-4-hydroxy-6-hydroxymethyldihydropteridine diphosphokinase [Planctomycetota bacterium]
MSGETTVYIGLGSNLGDREKNLNKALGLLAADRHINLFRTSSITETKPLADNPPSLPPSLKLRRTRKLRRTGKQRDYLNRVAEIRTTLKADKLLKVLKKIESAMGRKKLVEKWSSRTIDLDILLFGNKKVRKKDLCLPHRQMHLRSFVLKGLCELDGEIVHPVLKESVSVLYSRLSGKDFYFDDDRPQLVSIAGVIGAGKTTLAEGLRDLFGLRLIKESYDSNPFLPKVYAGQKSVALDSQLYFLLSRCEQLRPDSFPPGSVAVSDYIMDKEMLYARIWLDSVQFEIYRKVNAAMCKTAAEPVITVYIKLPPKKCLERIKQRSRPYEQDIDLSFLEKLHIGYEKLFETFNCCPVITIDAEAVDFRQTQQIEAIGEKINYYIGRD